MTNPATSPAPESGAGTSVDPAAKKPTIEEMLAAVLANQAAQTERLGKLEGGLDIAKKDLIKMRKRGADDQDGDGTNGQANGKTSKEPSSDAGRAGVLTQWDLTEALASMPSDARKLARELIEGGESIDNVLAKVKFAQSLLGAAESAGPKTGERPTPPGKAASAPPEPAGPQIKSWGDYQKFRQEQGMTAVQNYLQRHPTFDPTELPGSPGRRGAAATMPQMLDEV